MVSQRTDPTARLVVKDLIFKFGILQWNEVCARMKKLGVEDCIKIQPTSRLQATVGPGVDVFHTRGLESSDRWKRVRILRHDMTG
ncbi:hypothetical protein MTP99_013665 [Tenebrio molitor]|nr:hypothetical protein MTP99_013665 [Tenebrio molitor]